jgi:hypothetical protein
VLYLVELDHFLISAIDHLADIHIGKGIVRGVPIADQAPGEMIGRVRQFGLTITIPF